MKKDEQKNGCKEKGIEQNGCGLLKLYRNFITFQRFISNGRPFLMNLNWMHWKLISNYVTKCHEITRIHFSLTIDIRLNEVMKWKFSCSIWCIFEMVFQWSEHSTIDWTFFNVHKSIEKWQCWLNFLNKIDYLLRDKPDKYLEQPYSLN